MKHRNVRRMFLDLQRFASEETEVPSGETGTEEEAGEEAEEEDEDPEEKKFSRKEMDEEVEKRLARERRKWKRQQQKAGSKGKAGEEEEQSESEDAVARKAAEEKADSLEVKVACYEAGVAKEAVDDVAALARSYMAADETLDLEDAIEKVVGKYPQFKAGQEAGDEGSDGADQNKSWGERHRRAAKSSKTVDDEIKEQLFGK